jgi:hypothetical protein
MRLTNQLTKHYKQLKKQETQNKINIKCFKTQTITYNMRDRSFKSAVAILNLNSGQK